MNARMFLFSAGSLLVTLAVVIFALVSQPEDEVWSGREAYIEVHQGNRPLGVDAVITAGGQTIRTTWATLDFDVSSASELDPRLPDGPFEGTFTCRFMRESVAAATIGAEFQGGQLMILRDGKSLVSDFADSSEERLVKSVLPEALGAPYQEIVYEFTAKGDGPYRLRALWLPEGESGMRPLPGAGGS